MEFVTQAIEAAKAARKRAHCPYSGYAVGASVVFEADGSTQIVSGCNVENISYGLSNCAERTAVFSMIASWGAQKIEMLVVVTKDGGSPCGACRQVVSEFASPTCRILTVDENGTIQEFVFSELLPEAFSSRDVRRT